jgi:histidinol-phosphate aminotransferase
VTRLHGDTVARGAALDFAVNVWPLAPTGRLNQATRRALDHPGYPDQEAARTAVARRHDRDPGEVLLTNGACDALWLLAHVVRPGRATCVDPSFTEARAAFAAVGAQVDSVLRSPAGWSFDPAAVAHDADVVYVDNPNNPTGGLDSRERLLELARPGRLVVIDESFMEFVIEPEASLADESLPGVAVVRSLTKLWNLAGLRAGYLLAEAELVERLEAQRQPWPVNSVALAATEVCATDSHSPGYAAREIDTLRRQLVEDLRATKGVTAWDGAANFVLVEVDDGARVTEQLLGRGIAVRPAADFTGLNDNYIRVCVRRESDNAQLVEALREVVDPC